MVNKLDLKTICQLVQEVVFMVRKYRSFGVMAQWIKDELGFYAARQYAITALRLERRN